MKNLKDEQLIQDALDQKEAEEFLKELREMPYNRDRVGQVSVTVRYKIPSINLKNMEESQKK
jgi:hypothetical protein